MFDRMVVLVSRSYSVPVRVQLVEVINEDYADFVSLSTQLVNVDGAVARMQRPLGDLKVLVDAVLPAEHVFLQSRGSGYRS